MDRFKLNTVSADYVSSVEFFGSKAKAVARAKVLLADDLIKSVRLVDRINGNRGDVMIMSRVKD